MRYYRLPLDSRRRAARPLRARPRIDRLPDPEGHREMQAIPSRSAATSARCAPVRDHTQSLKHRLRQRSTPSRQREVHVAPATTILDCPRLAAMLQATRRSYSTHDTLDRNRLSIDKNHDARIDTCDISDYD